MVFKYFRDLLSSLLFVITNATQKQLVKEPLISVRFPLATAIARHPSSTWRVNDGFWERTKYAAISARWVNEKGKQMILKKQKQKQTLEMKGITNFLVSITINTVKEFPAA